jgi:phage baseplate assembly protein W
MSIGLSPKLPLQLDQRVGSYQLNRTYLEMIKQNFKNLLLTNPGERIMDTRFGVGLSTFLFEQKSDEVKSQIAASINRQTTLYMPFISINQIVFPEELGDVPVDPNSLDMRVEYSVPSIGLSDFVDISI